MRNTDSRLLLSIGLVMTMTTQVGCRERGKAQPATITAPTRNNILHTSGVLRAIEGQRLVIGFSRFEPGSSSASIDYATGDVTSGDPATAGVDYESTNGTLIWGPNDGSEKFVRINTFADRLPEGTESFELRLSNAIGVNLQIPSVVCNLLDTSPVPILESDVDGISATNGGSQKLTLKAGLVHADRRYILAGSLDKTPGFRINGVHVPLNPDTWFRVTLGQANTTVLRDFRGIFDFRGEASAEIRIPAISTPNAIGITVYHAYVVHDLAGTIYAASNAVSLTILN